MHEISANLSSPAWWFSAVVVALLINMISAYAKPWSDGMLSRLSERWRTRSEAKRKQLDEAVERRVLNSHLLRDSAEQEARLRQQSIFMLLLALLLLFFSELSGMTPKTPAEGLSSLAVGVLLLILKFLGLAMTIGAIAVSNAAEISEAIVHKANLYLAAIQDSRREQQEELERTSPGTQSK